MEFSMVSLIGILGLFILLASGMYIGMAMFVVGFLGYCFYMGVPAGLGLLSLVPYSAGASYMLTVIPLFVLMGQFAHISGISSDIFKTVHSWIGHFRGGLAMATVIGCAGFGAVSGSSLATSATMGMVAIPEMQKFGYNEKLATGCVAAGGTLGILIPPSLGFVIYGILTEQSIGKLFLAGIIPGVVLAALFVFAIFVQCRIDPSAGPRGKRLAFREKVLSLKGVWGILALFLLVMGGIYAGAFTPTEAAGIGAFGSFLITLGKKKLNYKKTMQSLFDTGKTTAMLFFIIIGAEFFSKFLGITMLPMVLSSRLAEMALNPYLILLSIILVFFILGCVMDCVAIMILTTPIIFPVITALGFDPIWFGVLMVVVLEVGLITPPVGMNVFIIKGVAGGVEIGAIFRGIVPFLGACVTAIFLLIAFPQIALLIPGLMK